MIYLFWILLFLIIYSYIIYPVLIFLLGSFWGKNKNTKQEIKRSDLPTITLLVTAYNEIDVVEQKVQNSYSLVYPKGKLKYLWVTDGSNDGTPEKLKQYENITLLHSDERKGKIHAMNRAATTVESDIIVFCDANTLLTKDTLLHIGKHFNNPKVGCVAGEKQIIGHDTSAAGTGEGLYWKYESWIKRFDFKFNTTLGAAGELFAVRRELYQPVEADTVLDDFIISLRIAASGYIVAYEPKAIAREYPSFSVREEMKRKVRIAAGGFQSLGRLKQIMNPFRSPRLAFQFFSHKFFRWLVCPLALIAIIPVHVLIIIKNPSDQLFIGLAIAHLLVYFLAITGWMIEKKQLRQSWLYLPYYFISTNYAQIKGLLRYLRKTQSVNWERARRANKKY